MFGTILEWLQNVGRGLLEAGNTLYETFQNLAGYAEETGAELPPMAEVSSMLQREAMAEAAEGESDQRAIADWFEGISEARPGAVDEPVDSSTIRQAQYEMSHNYKVVVRYQSAEGEKWTTQWYDHVPTPAEILLDAENYQSLYGAYDAYKDIHFENMAPTEYEVIESEEGLWPPGAFQ